jgi:hypothetical protein
MVTRDLILSNARPTGPAPGLSLEDQIGQALNLMRGRKLHTARGAAGGLQFPFAVEALAPIADSMRLLGETLPVDAIRQLLTDPFRAYALDSASEVEESLGVIAGYEMAGGPTITVLGRLRAPRIAKRWPSGVTLNVDVFNEDDGEALTEGLERLVLERIPAERFAADSQVHQVPMLWVGGSLDEVRSRDWSERIRAMGLVRGFGIEIIEQPVRRFAQVRDRLNQVARRTIFWQPYCGGKEYALAAGIGSLQPVYVQAPDLDGALVEARERLAEFIDVDDDGTTGAVRELPRAGETRYYKKHFSRRGGGDKMVDRGDCNHGAWTFVSNGSAPQAERGIAKLERDTPWVKLEKCTRCTGGGVWRATY